MRTGLLPLAEGASRNRSLNARIPDLPELPKEFDWRSRGVVTPVREIPLTIGYVCL